MGVISRIRLQDQIPEGTTQKLNLGPLKDENGITIPAASIATLAVTLYKESTAALVNPTGRPAQQSIKNENGGVADGSDNWSLRFGALDTVLLDQSAKQEVHILLLEWTYSIDGVGRVEIEHIVENLLYVG